MNVSNTSSSSTAQHATHMNDHPHVAYLLLWYPVFTQPFIFREVEGLRRLGYPLSVYSLYAESLGKCSPEMRAVASATHTMGMRLFLPVLWALVCQWVLHPLRMWRMSRKVLGHWWPSFEVLGEIVWAWAAGVYLAPRIKAAGIDHIHAPWPRGTATAAWVVSELSGIPFSIAARGDNLNPADPDLVDKLRAAVCIRANNRADELRIQALLPLADQHKTQLIYNSLTLEVQGQASVPMQKPVQILAVGRFDITKGFEYLLEACKILQDAGLDFQLTLAGGGGRWLGLGLLGPKLKKMCVDLGLQNCVRMPGLITHADLPATLLRSDIFVAPCVIHDSGRRDGIPNTVIEAMAYGLPTVATNINALPEIVRHNETGLSVPEKDPVALAAALRYLMEHPQKARQLGHKGSQLVQAMFQPDHNVRQLAAMFLQTIKD